MLTVHHLAMSQSERVVWLCEELALDYALVRYEREPNMLAPAAYKALHPAGTAPTITDGAVTLAETGAVFAYILERYGKGRLVVAPDDPAYADYLFWYHFANGSMMPGLFTSLIIHALGGPGGNPLAQGVLMRAEHGFAMLESRLSSVPYLAGGDFTAADITALFALTTMAAFTHRDLTPFPAIMAYVARVQARPAYRQAMAKAEPHG